jgi:hypothetical protein
MHWREQINEYDLKRVVYEQKKKEYDGFCT